MKLKYLLISSFLIVSFIAFGILLSLGVRRLPDVSQPQVKKEVWIYKGHEVSQTIRPLHDGFNVVHIYLRNVSLRNQDRFVFTVSDSGGTVIRKIDLTGYNIGDGDNVRFQFAPIPDSAGKEYTINLSSPETTYAKSIGVGFISGNNYPGGDAHVSGETPGDIAFSAFYFPTNRLEVITSSCMFFARSVFQPRFILMLVVLSVTGWLLTSRFFVKTK